MAMRWGFRNKLQHPQEQQEDSKGGKSKAAFSPFAWLSNKLTGKNNAAAAKPKRAPAELKKAGGIFPSCFHGPSHALQSSPAESSPAAPGPGIAPRRLSVGNDDAGAEAEAAAARQLYRRRHCSVGGERDLPPIRHLVPFSHAASPQRAPAPIPVPVLKLMPLPARTASDTDEDLEERPQSHQRRHRGGRRRSFSGKTPGARVAAVRIRSPRLAAVSELERFAVVRRTRNPQREFRASMVEMIASRRIGRPDELETLLACYLSLNADENHDCIVKVFRQVWFELNPARATAAVSAPTRSRSQ